MLISVNSRQRDLLTYLLGREGPVAASQLATRGGASLRTIRYDLDAIRAALKGTGLRLETKPRIGLWIEGPADRREAMARLLSSEEQPTILSPQAREDRLLRELLVQNEGVVISDLAETLRCGRTTLLRDLPAVESRLKGFGLRLERRHGRMTATGEERRRREALVQSLLETANPADLVAMLRGTAQGELPLPEAVTGRWRVLAGIISRTEQSLGKKFTDEAFVALVVHLSVALQRLQQGQALTMPAGRLQELKQRPEWQTASDMAEAITAATGIPIPEVDRAFLTLHLAGSRAQALPSHAGATAPLEPDPRITELADRFIRRSGAVLGVDLTGDQLLRDGLAWHLQGLLTRQRYQMTVTNPLRSEIKLNMDRVYKAVAGVAAEMESDLEAPLSDDEIGFLTMHIGAAMERTGHSPGIRILVVCSTGLGSAQLLAARLVRVFTEAHIVGVVSALESVEPGWYQQVDLVVTTVALANLPVPQVRVSPMLTAPEIELVKAAMQRAAGGPPSTEPAAKGVGHPLVAAIMHLLPTYAAIRDHAGLQRALEQTLVAERPPLELIEPILREVHLLGIQMDPLAQAGLAVHLQMALPRFRAGQYVREPELDRLRKEHLSLFRAVQRGLELVSRWHGVTIAEEEAVPIMRYILGPR